MADKNANGRADSVNIMNPESKHFRLPLHKRIIFWFVLPVVIVGIIISGILTATLSPPMESFLQKQSSANLRLASRIGIGICENHFNQLLDMRLEDNPEMNAALKKEALAEIKAIGRQVPNVHMLVLENRRFIRVISTDFPEDEWELPNAEIVPDALQDTILGKEAIKVHSRYFPFWNWHIVSFVYEKDYLNPIETAKQIIYLSTTGVLAAVFITLLFVFHMSVTKPLNRLIVATQNVSAGKLIPVDSMHANEIGQLIAFFNSMVESLKTKTGEIDDLIKQLTASEKRYRNLVELSPDAVFVHQAGLIHFINRSGAILFGTARPEELVGKPLMELIHPDYQKTVASRIQIAYDSCSTLPPLEVKYVTVDNRVIDVESTGLSIEYSGKPAILSVIRDITERKRTEKALRESEERLLRSKKMESLGLLAGGVAHDLNNVLSGIVSYPELILMDLPEDSILRKPIETIKDSGDRAVAIVQDLLTVARGVATIKAPTNLNGLIHDYLKSPEFKVLSLCHPDARVRTSLEMDLLNMNGSKVHIRKVLMNLVSNALEAIPGKGTVTLATMNRYVERPIRGYEDVAIGEYAVLSVSDDGPGISGDNLDRIFEPFYSKKVMGRSGTGLGLAVVWNVVQDHKGYIDVTTGVNGTTFELYFPVTRDELAKENLPVLMDALKGNGESILVVDDVASQRTISCAILNKLGYRTTAVSSGEEAVEFLKGHPADLLLLDMIMDPGINGRETYARVLLTCPDQKAIIVSGFAETKEVIEAKRLGAVEFLRKPVTFEKMGLAVKKVLGN